MTPADRQLLRRLDAREITGLTIYLEARGESESAKIGVGSVIRNRVRTEYRGETYHEVCLAKDQFSCWNDDDPNQALGLMLAQDMRAAREQDIALKECLFFALGIVSDQVRDNTGGARHYHDTSVRPAWALGHTPTASYGRLIFFAGVP